MADERRFSDDEAEAVLRLALESQRGRGGVSRAELIEAAKGVGVEPDDIDAAIATMDRGETDAALTLRWRAARRRGLVNHALAFAVGNALLFALDYATPPDDFWFYWPLLAWALGLAWDALGLLRGPTAEELDAMRAEVRATGVRVADGDVPAEAVDREAAAEASRARR
jgi:hypothetical protein